MTASPAQIAAAWRAFRGERKGALIGSGPGFREAIEAAMAVGETERAAAAAEERAVAETEQLTRDLAADLYVRLRNGKPVAEALEEPIDMTIAMEGLKRLAGPVALDAAVRRLAGVAEPS